MSIGEDWRRIEDWLSTHAPQALGRLPPGASEAALAKAEETMGFAFPSDLRASLTLHDGNNGIFWLHEDEIGALMSLSEIVRTWQMLVELFGDGSNDTSARPPRLLRRRWWHRKWVPFLHSDMGDKTCIDLDPAKGGNHGQVFYWSHTNGPQAIVATSYEALLGSFARDLQEGRYVCETGFGGQLYVMRVE